jgi:hypothetical protein
MNRGKGGVGVGGEITHHYVLNVFTFKFLAGHRNIKSFCMDRHKEISESTSSLNLLLRSQQAVSAS